MNSSIIEQDERSLNLSSFAAVLQFCIRLELTYTSGDLTYRNNIWSDGILLVHITSPELSVVIPVYNERENIPILWKSLVAVMDRHSVLWEVIWVNDGSTDGSIEQLQVLKRDDSRVHVITLERNHGQSAAFLCGVLHARGRIIITLDADLQNDPLDIPVLLNKLEDADMVVGWRKERDDPFLKRMASKIANAIRNWITGENIPDVGCSLKTFKREVFLQFFPFHGMHRFFPTLASLAGFRVVVVPVRHHPRKYGQSKYGIWNRLVGPLFDCFFVAWMKRRYLGSVRAEELTDE